MSDKEEIEVPFKSLVADIVTHMFENSASVHNRIAEYDQAKIAELIATLELIREGVSSLFDKGYMPTEAIIIKKLYPSKSHVEQRIEFNKTLD